MDCDKDINLESGKFRQTSIKFNIFRYYYYLFGITVFLRDIFLMSRMECRLRFIVNQQKKSIFPLRSLRLCGELLLPSKPIHRKRLNRVFSFSVRNKFTDGFAGTGAKSHTSPTMSGGYN